MLSPMVRANLPGQFSAMLRVFSTLSLASVPVYGHLVYSLVPSVSEMLTAACFQHVAENNDLSLDVMICCGGISVLGRESQRHNQ
jgi:hypothetical protein